MFIGREEELKFLRKMVSQNAPGVAVLYGRRRIGKSALIREAFIQNEKILFFEGLEDQSQSAQMANFIFQLKKQISIELPNSVPKTWRECLDLLTPILKKNKYIVVFDEFQWMANYRHTLVSDLKMIWDQYWSQSKMRGLVLCGSVASFMTKNVIRSKAFYGRVNTVIHLQELAPSEAKQILPRQSVDDCLIAMMHLGGVPFYLRQIESYASLSEAIENLCFTTNGYFAGEFSRIFASHFGKSAHFLRIIRSLSDAPQGVSRTTLAEMTGIPLGGTLSGMLDDLESAGFISHYVPFDKPEDARLRKYQLSDSYLNFYFSFIHKNLKQMRPQARTIFQNIYGSPAYAAWLGFAFERFCVHNNSIIAKILGFDGVNYRVGPLFQAKTIDNPGMQIDLLFDRGDNTIIVCEMKYSRVPIKLGVSQETQRKIDILRERTRKTILPVLITNNIPSKELAKSSYFYKTIRAESFFS